MNREKSIFKKGSTTFFMSSLFFPRIVKQEVFDLYSFVRVADNYVDQVPADPEGFHSLRQLWTEAVTDPDFETVKSATDSTNLRVVKNMVNVTRKCGFELEWVEAFLDAMESDLSHKPCQTIDETLKYVYGSAEVIGLMMSRIMGLPAEAEEAAQMQGRALQMINFIRDIHEDNQLGRQYLPADELARFNLKDITAETAHQNSDDFTDFINFQLNRYERWQTEAEAGYTYIPKRLRIPLETARDMYGWTACEIRKNPLKIYEKKIKPSKSRIIGQILTNIV